MLDFSPLVSGVFPAKLPDDSLPKMRLKAGYYLKKAQTSSG
jgi:hypothetical protein